MLINGYKIMRNADLQDADLQDADLRNADLQDADLRSADLRNANLRYADLRSADLRYANLRYVNLRDADLQKADLRNADLRKADLRGVNISQAKFSAYLICPEIGGFFAWKKVVSGATIKLYIPANAKRMSSLVGRKCRAEYVKVVLGSGISDRGGEYKCGEIYRPDKYDDDIRVECSHGVHFFMTKQEAEQW